ncbi:MAG: fenitrothion hydrolase [Solirubrobacterales bacterium]
MDLALPLAHALVGREDLPIPAWLFAWGASLVLIVSFAALAVAWRAPRFEQDRWRPLSERLSRLAINPVTETVAGLIGVFLLGVVVWTGLSGTDQPNANFSVTFVFVTAWLGMVLLSVLFGDLFRAFNPWRAIARAVGGAFSVVGRRPRPAPLPYPKWLGRWPAVVGILAFLWLELVFPSGTQTGGVAPRDVALATLVYTAITLFAMSMFGTERWLERGEAFSVYFGMFSRLAPLERRGDRLGVRRPLSAAGRWAQVPGSVALVLVAIGGTSFDGAQEGALTDPIKSVFDWLTERGLGFADALRVTDTLFLALTLLAVTALFALGIRGMRTVPGSPSVDRLRRAFGHTLIPIALAYLVAHYFSLFLFQEQAQFGYLLSDPLGDGSDYFGTASSGIDYALIGATEVWYVQVAALVIGHVAGLTLAHDRALATYRDPRSATRSQYWMLAVMIGFTCLGLFLLSQANA